MQLDLDAQPLRFLLDALAYVNVTGSWQPPDATHTNTTHMVLALLSEIGRVETRNLTRRGETADAARLQGGRGDGARGAWDMGRPLRCCRVLAIGARCSVSLMRFDATGRVTNQALVNLPQGRLYSSQDASSRLMRTFIGNLQYIRWAGCVSTHGKIGRDDYGAAV